MRNRLIIGGLQRKAKLNLTLDLLARRAKAELIVEPFGRPGSSTEARQKLVRVRTGAHVIDEERDGTATEATPLMSGIDHETHRS
ncbi:MAG: hypothetical protein ACYS0D_06765 [Planctomycetota bacterium]